MRSDAVPAAGQRQECCRSGRSASVLIIKLQRDSGMALHQCNQAGCNGKQRSPKKQMASPTIESCRARRLLMRSHR